MENDECTHTPWGTNNFLMVIKFSLEMEDEHSSFNKSSRTGSQLNNLLLLHDRKTFHSSIFPSVALTFEPFEQEKVVYTPYLSVLIIYYGTIF